MTYNDIGKSERVFEYAYTIQPNGSDVEKRILLNTHDLLKALEAIKLLENGKYINSITRIGVHELQLLKDC